MKKNIIEQLRRLSSVPGKQKTWVSQLGDDQLYELFLKLRSGESAASIARHAQKAWKVGANSAKHSVSQGVLKFKDRIAPLLPGVTVGMQTSDSSHGADPEDALETMDNIARQYETRIKGMIAEERETGVKYPYINRDLQALAILRKAILKQKDWESSNLDPLKQRDYQKIKERIDRRFNNWMEELGEDGQERMIKIADRFLELVEQHAVPMYRKEDGTYTLIKNQTQ